MIAVDSNILVYAHRRDMQWYDRAAECVRGLAEGDEAWIIPWPCIHEFLAIVTNPRIFSVPTPIDLAVDQVEQWIASPTLELATETSAHWTTLRDLISRGRAAGPLVHDARIAAICADYDATALWSADRDFARFPRLRVVNPLITS